MILNTEETVCHPRSILECLLRNEVVQNYNSVKDHNNNNRTRSLFPVIANSSSNRSDNNNAVVDSTNNIYSTISKNTISRRDMDEEIADAYLMNNNNEATSVNRNHNFGGQLHRGDRYVRGNNTNREERSRHFDQPPLDHRYLNNRDTLQRVTSADIRQNDMTLRDGELTRPFVYLFIVKTN